MGKYKIGLFGGTFDPPHIGHMILASEAAFQFDLTKVFWALAPEPPHKLEQAISPLERRIEMLQLAIQDNSVFEFSRLEIDRPGPHYTVDTLELLQKLEPTAEIYLLMGGDSLRNLHTWRRYTDLIQAVPRIGVLRRPGDLFDFNEFDPAIRPILKEKATFIDSFLHNLSSREIRRRAANGEAYRYYLHPAVYEYIESNRLYRA